MSEEEEIARDAISATIHADLQAWLQDTANTAETAEQVHDMTVGAVSALFCFLWLNRRPGATRHDIVSTVARMGAAVLMQLPDDLGSGVVQ